MSILDGIHPPTEINSMSCLGVYSLKKRKKRFGNGFCVHVVEAEKPNAEAVFLVLRKTIDDDFHYYISDGLHVWHCYAWAHSLEGESPLKGLLVKSYSSQLCCIMVEDEDNLEIEKCVCDAILKEIKEWCKNNK